MHVMLACLVRGTYRMIYWKNDQDRCIIIYLYIVRTLSTEKSGSRLTDVIHLHWCVAAACVCVVGGKSESSTIMYNALGILFYYIFTVNDECVVSFFFFFFSSTVFWMSRTPHWHYTWQCDANRGRAITLRRLINLQYL